MILKLSSLLRLLILLPQINAIFDGKSATETQFPYQVSICSRQGTSVNHHICGGAILTRTIIITAGHCINPNAIENYTILIGSPYRYEGYEHRIKKAIIHEDYDIEIVLNDIALIQLENSIRFSAEIASISLNKQFINENEIAIVSGWGESESSARDWHLKYAYLKTITIDKCFEMSSNTAPIHNQTTLCAFSGQIGIGICTGDSGNPLVLNNSLIGITSWSTTPCATGQPDGFTRISEYVFWIEQSLLTKF